MELVKKSLLIIWIFIGVFSFALADEKKAEIQLEIKPVLISEKIKNSELKIPVCTMDVKICADGSGVGRIGPDCEFAPCPKNTEEEIEENLPPVKEKICPLFKITDKCPDGSDWKYILDDDGCQIPTCTNLLIDEDNIENDNHLLLIEKIKNAKNEEERIKILKKEQKNILEKKVLSENIKDDISKNDTESKVDNSENTIFIEDKTKIIIAEKSKDLFTKVDRIILKLKEVVDFLNLKILELNTEEESTFLLKNKINNLSIEIINIEKNKAEVWILLQETIDSSNKTELKNNLETVKIMLKSLKNEIKVVSLETKEVINSLKELLNK